MALFPPSLWLRVIASCMASSVPIICHTTISLLPVLAVVPRGPKITGIPTCFQLFILSEFMPWRGIAGSWGASILFFNEPTYSSPYWMYLCTSQTAVQGGSLSPHPLQHVLFKMFWEAILICVRTHLTGLLICLFLIICDAEHLFMCQLHSVGLPQRNIHFNLWPIISWVVCIFDTELQELFICLGAVFLVGMCNGLYFSYPDPFPCLLFMDFIAMQMLWRLIHSGFWFVVYFSLF